MQTIQDTHSWKTTFSRYIKRNMYRWHRTVGLITVIPVIFWTLSGMMHPFMSHWFKPSIAHERMTVSPLPKEQIKLSVAEVLQKNGLTHFRNFRLVSFQQQTFYQIKDSSRALQYFNAQTAQPLPNGDIRYAEYMARYLTNDQTSRVLSVKPITQFDHQYKEINRLLPVWKVTFDRPDGLEIYLDTQQSRMATFNTTSRKAFIWIFDVFHNWSFLDFFGDTARLTLMLVFLSVILFSTLSGLTIYGLLWKRFKKPVKGSQVGLLRRNHRQIGIAVSLVTLLFAFSGAWHAFQKYTPDERNKFVFEPIFATTEVEKAALMPDVDWERLLNVQLVRMGKRMYFQLFYDKTDVADEEVVYQHIETGQILQNGTIIYAKYLTNKFANLADTEGDLSVMCCTQSTDAENTEISNANLKEATLVTRFGGEYGFVNKRLPVVKLSYATPTETAYYIETATSRLAAKVENADRAEGWSFAMLHKYLLLEWAGKNVRDIITILSALGVLTVSLFGLVLFLRK